MNFTSILTGTKPGQSKGIATKTIVKLQFKNETNLATMIELLKIGKDELKKMPYKLHEQEEVSAKLEVSPKKETSGKGTRSVLQRPQRSGWK